MLHTQDAITRLSNEIEEKEEKTVMDLNEYLEIAQQEPRRVFRNIFQLFYDMIKNYVGEGVDEHPADPESIGFVKYDCSKLFVEGADSPFFADRLFANRFVRQGESLRHGFQQNRVYAYEGPSGCGKSTFFNNLLHSFETYTNTKEGRTFEIFWEIDGRAFDRDNEDSTKVVVPCPSHDYPILIIPKKNRPGFLRMLFQDNKEMKEKIFTDKDYEWIFRGEVCTICKSIFRSSLERLGSLQSVLRMVKARAMKFDRSLGEGISVFNPGDRPTFGSGMVDGKPMIGFFTDSKLQEKLDKIFGTHAVRYIYSPLAKTNNGIYVLMDVKGHNEDRLLELHNVISEGVHKVSDIEERVSSLFFALMNPEDKRIIEEKKMESFQGRIQYNVIPYVLEPNTEVSIYRSIFGKAIEKKFLPRVLENFARVLVASRMNTDCKPLQEWISSLSKYKRYCDENGLLLRMEIYNGIIPGWLSEEDKKKFTKQVRRNLIAEGEHEGKSGFSGRDSIRLFSELHGLYKDKAPLINMEHIVEFFKHKIGRERRDECIPKNFLTSLVDSYEYQVLNEIKESLYFYNKERISRDILNYFFAVNHDIGSKLVCPYTKEEIEVTLYFLKLMAGYILGREISDRDAVACAQEIQKKYVTVISRDSKHITETDLYKETFNAYVMNIKEKALEPFVRNPNFREAIKSYGTDEFETFDTRLKEHVRYMVKNLTDKFRYSEQGAKEIALYVIDKDLAKKFS